MIGWWATKLAVMLLRSGKIGNEERQLLTTAIINRLGALPVRARITIDEANQIFIDGKKLTVETARRLHDGSKAMLNNFARKIVREQIVFMAVHKGVHENVSPEQGLFAKAALWNLQEEEELYRRFALEEIIEDDQERTL